MNTIFKIVFLEYNHLSKERINQIKIAIQEKNLIKITVDFDKSNDKIYELMPKNLEKNENGEFTIKCEILSENLVDKPKPKFNIGDEIGKLALIDHEMNKELKHG